ncbi:TetR/AcrR family transcriptional regulator [Jiangella ureilytica]|uniref:TetR/AcrR family transcriptional regulator n=1 Tax=Jiangella ureilytica TaxID=2530374 RepID=A0A4R4RGQ9_9ACTN|nr:TetR/AcrR family transcriptional regulator [Jiangella ureilytica]TDC47722.1 TetR/AcrR family transcriptional regulator [Jiangella ureilytica]
MGNAATREHIVDAADQLFYRHGYEHTTFSDIADVVQISRGNFYYHFRSKDEILDAVIKTRLKQTQELLEQWEADAEQPADRIRSFIHMWFANRADIALYGCPVGTLTTELAKLDHTSQRDATALFTLYRSWLRRQFTLLGRGADADALAMHLLAMSQGVAAVANAFRDEDFIAHEVTKMCEWLSSYTDDAERGTPDTDESHNRS